MQTRDSNSAAAPGGGCQLAVAGVHAEAAIVCGPHCCWATAGSAAKPRTAISKGLFSWALRGEMRWIWHLRPGASETVLQHY